MQGPVGAAYLKLGVVVATDCSVKHNCSMGAAAVALGDRVFARSAAVFGTETSVTPELTGLAMALVECPVHEDLTLLTDSKSSMDIRACSGRTSPCGSTGILHGSCWVRWRV